MAVRIGGIIGLIILTTTLTVLVGGGRAKEDYTVMSMEGRQAIEANYKNWQIRESLCNRTVRTDVDIYQVFRETGILEHFIPVSHADGYWEASCESMISWRGNCIDYAILASKLILGWNKKILILKSTENGTGHAAAQIDGVIYDINYAKWGGLRTKEYFNFSEYVEVGHIDRSGLHWKDKEKK